MGIWETIFGDANEKYLKSLQPLIDKINELEYSFQSLTKKLDAHVLTDFISKEVHKVLTLMKKEKKLQELDKTKSET